MLGFWTIYKIVSVVLITLIFLFAKFFDDSSIESWHYFVACLVVLMPYLNVIVCALLLLLIFVALSIEGIGRLRKSNIDRIKSHDEIKTLRRQYLPKALIGAGYFKSGDEVDDFVDGYLVANKLKG